MADAVKEVAWQIRAERAEDAPLVDALNAASFGPGRYVKSAYRLREGVGPVAPLSFVAMEDGGFRGSVRFWPIHVGVEAALLLGPLAVQSDQRGRGIGISLMKHGIEAARATGFGSILLVGDEPYYARVGFKKMPADRIRFSGPVDRTRVLGLALKADGLANLSGAVRRAHIDEPVCADGVPVAAR